MCWENKRFQTNEYNFSIRYRKYTGGLNNLPYLQSISVSMAVIKDFSTNYMNSLGLNQAYVLLKLRNNYHIVLICSFGSITGKILHSYKQKVYMFFL